MPCLLSCFRFRVVPVSLPFKLRLLSQTVIVSGLENWCPLLQIGSCYSPHLGKRVGSCHDMLPLQGIARESSVHAFAKALREPAIQVVPR